MEHVHMSEQPSPERATLIGAFTGWNDAASAASWAVKFLINQWDAQPFADIDPEEFYDFSETRPTVRISNGLSRQLTWPSNRFYIATPPALDEDTPPRSVILLLGDEPQLRWKTFTREVMEVCATCHVDEIVLLGALVAEVPHTAPVQISGTATREELLRRMTGCGVERAHYSGTTGILSVIQHAGRSRSIPTASLWGTAPHYISATPNLPVAEALLRKVDRMYDYKLHLRELAHAAERFTQRVSSLVAEDPDVMAYVHELEQRGDPEEPGPATSGIRARPDEMELPTAEQAVESVEEFLRQFREDS